jgi:hypothetical protein
MIGAGIALLIAAGAGAVLLVAVSRFALGRTG